MRPVNQRRRAALFIVVLAVHVVLIVWLFNYGSLKGTPAGEKLNLVSVWLGFDSEKPPEKMQSPDAKPARPRPPAINKPSAPAAPLSAPSS